MDKLAKILAETAVSICGADPVKGGEQLLAVAQFITTFLPPTDAGAAMLVKAQGEFLKAFKAAVIEETLQRQRETMDSLGDVLRKPEGK